MAMTPLPAVLLGVCAAITIALPARAEEPSPPSITQLVVSNTQTTVKFAPYPAAQEYKIQFSPDLFLPFTDIGLGSISGFDWTGPVNGSRGFYRLQVTPLSDDSLFSANLLNRIAYGPSPDDLARLSTIGPQAYIAEQLAPESIQEQLEIDIPAPVSETGWRYITATGNGSSSRLYIYLNAAGSGYIDDLVLVQGAVAGVGPNLLRNGGFESPLTNTDWTISTNHTGSAITTGFKHSGSGSLKLVASAAGTTRGSAIWQPILPTLSSSRTYTLSFWYLPSPSNTTATVRLSGSGIVASTTSWGSPLSQLARGEATITTLRSWHALRAIQSRRQLLEVLLQFFENHFVTEYTKSADFFDRYYPNADPRRTWAATEVEFKEIQRWRQALLNPACTFHDLLKISAESPAMIIYLDTVDSRGDLTQIANENYARELLELFTFGVDNGYDQNDIVEVSKVWTGWSVRKMAHANEFNPTVPDLQGSRETGNVVGELNGVWAFKFRELRHSIKQKLIFPGRAVPDRFGPPWAGRNYELRIPAIARTSTAAIQEGYTVIRHLADLPFTQEFISVKLCRLFVHDDFAVGYDFTDPTLSEEGKLVRDCMLAWESSSPQGQLRKVLEVIFNSELFRSHGGSMQKVKTPLEFVVSSLRALRADLGGSNFSVNTDGNIHTYLNRMGGMRLFDRSEPDGYPEDGSPWISAGTLAERLRFVQAFLMSPNNTENAGNSRADPIALLKAKLPQSSWSDAGVVADYFLGILYPAEGKANLDFYRQAALNFLNTADNGTTASLFSSLGNASTAYDIRVRGMVAMLMTFPRFQEQ